MSNNIAKFLEWDSVFFKKKIYKIDIEGSFSEEELENIRQEIGADLIYIFSKNELETNSIENFLLVDKKIIFEKAINSNSVITENINIISVNQLTPELNQLALLSGLHSRFKLDKFIAPKFQELYQLWIKKSIKREISDEVFAYVNNKKEIGFVTIKKNADKASIGLIAVNESFHGKNIGSFLINHIEKWCLTNNINILEVATQLDNEKACNFYIKNGFISKQIDYVYHFYKNK